MGPPALAELLGAPCRVRDVRAGEVVAVLVDDERSRVIGFDVRSAGGVHRFLPWVAAEVGSDGVHARSAFLLVDAGDSYVRLGARAVQDPVELEGLDAEPDGRLRRSGEVVSTGQ